MSSLATGVEIRSLGLFKEVTTCLLDMNQDVVKVILESKEDIWDNPELFRLVKEYFKSSVETMEFCTALGSSLERAKNIHFIIQLAIEQFEEEMKDGTVDKKFEKTLEGLQRFKAAGDPFTPQFFPLFQSVYEQQVPTLEKLLSGTWIVSSIQAGTSLTIWDMDSIRLIVVKLQVEIESLLKNADFAIREEDAVKLVIDKIKKKMTVFMDFIEDLAVHADKCNHDISQARKVILNSDINEVLRYV